MATYKKEYKMTYPYGDKPHHCWSIVGRHGAVHLHISSYELNGAVYFSGGLEFHHRAPPDYMRDDCPSHNKCWLLEQPCWHDRTSLYVSEKIIPMIEHALRSDRGMDEADHRTIFSVLESEMKSTWPIDNNTD